MRTYYQWLDGVLTDEECEEIIRFGTANLETASTHGLKVGSRIQRIRSYLKRKSKVSWIDAGSDLDPLMGRLVSKLLGVSRDNYFVDLDYVESIQFTRYDGGLSRYGWHTDSSANGLAASRIMSATVELSDPKDYVGGDLKLQIGGKNWVAEKRKGRMILFPSAFPHKVTPVLTGTRHSLVLWAHTKEPSEKQC
jgi:PKHD-type hydroxylase